MIRAPRVWIRSGAPDRQWAAGQIGDAVKAARPAARLITEAGPAIEADKAAAWLDDQRPDLVLALFAPLPRLLADMAAARNLALVLVHPDPEQTPPLPFWRRLGRAGRPLAGYARIMVPDMSARHDLLRRGAVPENLVITGPLTETRRPPYANEAELTQQAQSLGGRQCWYAVAVTEAEEPAILAAHQTVLGQSHRSLLIIEPADPRRAPRIAADCEAVGMHAGLRSELDAPDFDHQVLILDDPGEAGLWYRLAPICLMGGSFSGDDGPERHPFEAASLGSAILHGPALPRSPSRDHQQAWQLLRRAQATCPVNHPDMLARKLLGLMTPDSAATLAGRAWEVSTRGAENAARIAASALSLIGAGNDVGSRPDQGPDGPL